MSQEFTTREAQPADRPYIASTWRNSFVLHGVLIDDMRRPLAYDGARVMIENLISRPTTSVLIACLPDAPTVLVGWAAVEAETTIHYIYVRAEFRHHGVATALLAAFPGISHYSTRTKPTLRAARQSGWVYDPFRAFQKFTP